MGRKEERDRNHNEINKLMFSYYNTDNERNRKRILNEAYELLRFEAYKMKKNNTDWEDTFQECLSKCIKQFDPDKGTEFMGYFSRAYNNSNITHHSKEKDEVSIEESNEEGRPLEFSDDSENADYAAKRLIICLEALCDSVLAVMKKSMNSPKKCYQRYFFTEHIAHSLSSSEVIYRAVEENGERYRTASDSEFIDSFISDKYDDNLLSLRHAVLKKLSEFTGKEKDENEECGYPLKNCVYSEYLGVTEGAVSAQRGKYENIAKTIYFDALKSI